MAESGNSSSVTSTPIFTSDKYFKPTWQVKVNSVTLANAILQRVELGYGSDLSTATFILPTNPLTGSNPVEDDLVDIYVNGTLIFSGIIRAIGKHIGIDGLKLIYTCMSKLTLLNNTTVINGAFNSSNSDFPFTRFSARGVVNQFNIPTQTGISISGVPTSYPGEINVTDQTLLTALEAVLAKIGNYKVNYNFDSNSIDIYSLGTGGTNTRSFIVGSNVISIDITESSENVVDKVIVLGAHTQITRQVPIVTNDLGYDSNGRQHVTFRLTGRNIRNITVEGMSREKPVIEFDNHTFVNKAMLLNPEQIFQNPTFPSFDFNDDSFLDSNTNTNTDDRFILQPIILHQEEYTANWTQIPVELKYLNTDQVTVLLSEVPKMWYANLVEGYVTKGKIGLTPADELQFVQILDVPPNDFNYDVGAIRVTYTVDGSKPFEEVGSGPIVRTITDSQYQIIDDPVNHSATPETTASFVLANMLIRAEAEYAKTHIPVITGTLTVFGDESIKLKQTILVGSDLLDVVHVSHDFTNGFRTEVSLTNERLRTTQILIPFDNRQKNLETEKDRRRNLSIEGVDADVFRNRNQQSENAEKVKETKANSSPNAIYKA